MSAHCHSYSIPRLHTAEQSVCHVQPKWKHSAEERTAILTAQYADMGSVPRLKAPMYAASSGLRCACSCSGAQALTGRCTTALIADGSLLGTKCTAVEYGTENSRGPASAG